MAASRLRVPSMLVLLVALVVGAATARAGEKYEDWKESITAAATKRWPPMAVGDNILGIRPLVENARSATQERRREANRDGLRGEDVAFLEACDLELGALGEGLAEFAAVYVDGSSLATDLFSAVAVVARELEGLVEDVAGKPESTVRGGFRALQGKVEELRSRQQRAVDAVGGKLRGGFSWWRPRLPLFAPLHLALDERAKQLASGLGDAWERTFGSEKSVVAALEGDKGVLCDLCLRGRLEEARTMLKTWSPPRLVAVEDVTDALDGLPRESGWIDVVAHGTPGSMTLRLEDGSKFAADAKTVFQVIKKSLKAEDLAHWQSLNDDTDTGFRLVSCSVGYSPTGIAQGLANQLGVPVKAPDGVLWVLRSGGRTIPVIHLCAVCKGYARGGGGAWVYDHVLNSKERGSWRVFKPSTGEADVELRDSLLGLAKKKAWWQVTVKRVRVDEAKIDEVMKSLGEINPKLKGTGSEAKEVRERIAKARAFVAIDKLPWDDARKLVPVLAKLGLTAEAEPMSAWNFVFKGVKTD